MKSFVIAATIACLSLALCAIGRAQDQSTPQPDPQMKAVLDELAALNPKPIETLEPAEARKQPTPADAVKKVLEKQGKSTDPEPVGNVADQKIPGPKEELPVRVYTPKGDGPFPVLVYFHGGGFVIATVDTYDSSCRALCNMANCVVVSVEYRKAPENKYPAQVEDAYAAYEWVTKNAAQLKGDPAKIAVAGESAGGNLATVTCMMAKEKIAPMPIYQLLVYPVVNNDMNTPSYQQHANAKPLNKAMMGWFFKHYVADPNGPADPHLTPLQSTDLSGLPPAMILTAQIDPLLSEGQQYAEKLKAAGVEVQYKTYEGVTHEFFGMGAVVDKAKQAETDAAEGLKAAFAAKRS
jgi:acetyl esterase